MSGRIVKKTARAVLGSAVISGLKKRTLPEDALVVFSLHRIGAEPDRLGNVIRAAAFAEFVRWAKRNFILTTFAEVSHNTGSGRIPAILSFDDGYECYKTVVEPILEKFEVPANLNIIPKCVETGWPPINVHMQDIIAQGGRAERDAINHEIFAGQLNTADARQFAFQASRKLKSHPIAEQTQYWPVLRQIGSGIANFDPVRILDRETLRNLKRTELGAHSYEHASMEAEGDTYLESDFGKCRDWFQTELDQEARIYAFPNGSTSPNAAERALAAGYRDALLVGERVSRRGRQIHHRINMQGVSLQELRSCITLAGNGA